MVVEKSSYLGHLRLFEMAAYMRELTSGIEMEALGGRETPATAACATRFIAGNRRPQ